MATIFSRIIAGELPGHIVWEDETCVVFSTIEPITPGHMLLVPREEVESYWDAPAQTVAHMAQVAQIISRAQLAAFDATRVGQMVAGFDVPHLHIHLVPLRDQKQLTLSKAHAVNDDELEKDAQSLREALIQAGYSDNVPTR